jgi:hypothetical protein
LLLPVQSGFDGGTGSVVGLGRGRGRGRVSLVYIGIDRVLVSVVDLEMPMEFVGTCIVVVIEVVVVDVVGPGIDW